MALSSDWFLDHWHLIGLIDDRKSHLALQRKCRNIVDDMLNGAEIYWRDVPLTEERCKKTNEALLSSASNILSPDSLRTLSLMIESIDCHVDIGKVIFILIDLTQTLINDRNHLHYFSEETITAISRTWTEIRHDEVDILALSAQSESAWDRRIRSLTPGLPEMIPDYIIVNIVNKNMYLAFWRRINTILPEYQKSLLRDYYVAKARTITEIDFTIPEWMQ